ncbi:MAG: AraC family transcriptional regulator [Candidatus Rokuibacteriota bacterium]|nr:MAG: AraC family transcriptional regulator [Candidatus Rokubacteria bacterium]
MPLEQTRSAGQGLERSCQSDGSWIASARPSGGVELFRAWFAGKAYDTHRHDTYAVGLTDSGVQMFDYRGAGRASTAGQVVVLHPDEPHDGRAGTREGFGYRIVYVEPVLLGEALRAVRGRAHPLPFVREPVSRYARLARAVREAFAGPLQSLAIDSLVVDLAEGLTEGERGGALAGRRVDVRAVERARQLLDAECTRVVRSSELESITGLTRHDLARQFRIVLGTSPHRYLLMRRLDFARERMQRKDRLAEIAADAGFADQAHFTRAFKSAVGLTPARYRALCYTTSSVRAVVSPKRPSAKCGRPA